MLMLAILVPLSSSSTSQPGPVSSKVTIILYSSCSPTSTSSVARILFPLQLYKSSHIDNVYSNIAVCDGSILLLIRGRQLGNSNKKQLGMEQPIRSTWICNILLSYRNNIENTSSLFHLSA